MAVSFTSELADFATGTHDIPDGASRMAALSLLDWLAVGRAGVTEPVAKVVRTLAHQEAGAPQARVFGARTRAPARMAALVNGTTTHALDYDDTHFAHIGHPSVAVFPAALAVAELVGAGRSDLKQAALIGMEASIRTGLWLGRAHYQIGFHQTATAGAFGAAVAAGRLLGLNAQAMTHVLGLTATRAAGLKAQFGTMGKPYNAGQAAACGVEAAQLVSAGFHSNPAALDGPQGFGATHHGDSDATALDGIGAQWLFETVSHKFHACCHGLHAALEALELLRPVSHDQVGSVTINTHPRWMTVCNQIAPMTGLGAKFSYSTVTALTLLGHDTARLATYDDGLCADPAVQALRKQVTVVADETLSETEAEVRIALMDGDERTARHDLQAPMSVDARRGRVQAKAAALIGHDAMDEAWAVISSDGPVADLADLVCA